MDTVNKHVVIAGLVMLMLPFIHAAYDPAFNNRNRLTQIMLGSGVFMILLSTMDLLGDDIGRVASALAYLTVVAAILADMSIITGTGSILGGSGNFNPGPTAQDIRNKEAHL